MYGRTFGIVALPEEDVGNLVLTLDCNGRRGPGYNAVEIDFGGRRVEVSLMQLTPDGRVSVAFKAPRDVAIHRARAKNRQPRQPSSPSPRPAA